MEKILVLLFVCQSASLLAQKSFLGADAGTNLANQRIVSYPNNNPPDGSMFFKNAFRMTFGIFYQYQLNDKMGLRLNGQYMGLGYDSKSSASGNLSINYFTLPLTFHYSVTHHLSFHAGPYLSFTLGGTKINNQEITKTYHHNDDGIVVGGEHDLYKNLAISVSYICGLKNIWLNDSYDAGAYILHTKLTNRALQLTLIYKFKKNK